MNCIIIDDEPASRDILKKYISNCPSLNLVCICKNTFEATAPIEENNIQLVFLDINMPKLSGLTFYKSLTNPPAVIFTTAYPEYAIDGFEVDAIDYLLKPFSFERFLKAVNRTSDKLKNKDHISICTSIMLKADKKLYKINTEEIYYLEALGDYVKIYYSDKSIMVHDTFKNLLNQLPEPEFIRVHKSFAISLNKLEVIDGNTIKIKDKTIPIGQTYKTKLIERIKSLG